jgi:prevent-host-death family protein
MPIILPSSDLRNKYNEISETCHKTGKPIYITKNGKGDLAVMDINVFEYMIEKYDLYEEIEKGVKDFEEGRYYTADEVYTQIENKIKSLKK